MADEFVTVAKFANSFEARLAKMRLDANGIDSFVVGETFANMYPVPQIGFIELQVAAVQADEAAKILESAEQEQ